MSLSRPVATSGPGVAALQLWIFVFVAVAGTAVLASYPPLRTAALLLYAVPVLAWAILRVRGPWGALDAAILLGLVLHLVVSLASADPIASLEATGATAAFAAVFWLARAAAATPLRARIAAAIAAALAFWVAVIAVTWVMEKVADIQLFGWPPRLEAHQPYVWGSINTPPVLLLLAVPFVVFMPEGRLRGMVTAILVAGALVIVPFSVGRAAWLGIGVAMVAAEVLFGFPMTRRAFSARGRLVAAAGLGAAAVLGGAYLIVTRFDAIALALDSRLRLWVQALSMFNDDPLTGSGPMTFAWARLQHVPDYVDRVAAGAAHNVAIQTLADGGLLLAAALALVVGTWIRAVVRGRHGWTAARRVAIAALVGFAATTLLDDLSFLPAITVIVVVLAAWTLPGRRAPQPSATGFGAGLVLPVVLVGVVLASLPAAVSMTLMRFEASAGRDAALAGDWAMARQRFERATELQPASALHLMSMALAEYHLGAHDAARREYDRARTANPGDPRPWGALAALAADDGERVALLAEAAQRSNDPQYAWRLGMAHLDGDRGDAAARALAIASVYEPDLVPLAVTLSPALDAAALVDAGELVGSLAEIPPVVAAWNVTLLMDRIDPGAPVAWVVARRADAGDATGASAALADAIRAGSHDPRAHAAAGAVAHLTCDATAYRDSRERMLALVGDDRRLGQPVSERRIGIYGVPDLGDYQPIDHAMLPAVPAWPLALIEVPDCGW